MSQVPPSEAVSEPKPQELEAGSGGWLERFVSEADETQALLHVENLRDNYPEADVDTLVEMLIRQKCLKAGGVGATTSGVAVLPVVGTFTAMTVGLAADLGLTFKLQAELVLEIAAAHGRRLNTQQKRTIVTSVTGVSAGTSLVLSHLSREVLQSVVTRILSRGVSKGLPVIGIASAAGANIFGTYVVGQRAHAYFSLGPQAVGDWNESVRAITGVDERKIAEMVNQVVRNSGKKVDDNLWRLRKVSRRLGKAIAGGIKQVGQSFKPAQGDDEDLE